MPKNKHLFNKKIRDKNAGFCPTSLWGPFCYCCRDKMHKKLEKTFKNIDIKNSLKNLDFEKNREKVKKDLVNDPIHKGYKSAIKLNRY